VKGIVAKHSLPALTKKSNIINQVYTLVAIPRCVERDQRGSQIRAYYAKQFLETHKHIGSPY
jgi:hypothetical protein